MDPKGLAPPSQAEMEGIRPSLVGTKTGKNLKEAFAKSSEAHARYLYFARKADIEGYNDVSAVIHSTAEGKTGHAHGHLEFLEEVGDPATARSLVRPLAATGSVLVCPGPRTGRA